MLRQSVDKLRVQHSHLVDLARNELVRSKFCDRPNIGETNRILQSEVGSQISSGASDKLHRFSTHHGKFRFFPVDVGEFSEKARVQRAAKPFVRRKDQDQLSFNRTDRQKLMARRFDAAFDRGQNPRQHFLVRSSGKRSCLSLAHLGSSHHLHGFGDLSRIFYRLNSPAQIEGAGHRNELRFVKAFKILDRTMELFLQLLVDRELINEWRQGYLLSGSGSTPPTFPGSP